MDQIMNVKTEQLAPHPDNPRKDLGDLTELTASIKAMGVLSPLLVIHMMDGTYRIIAGHRRAAAAKAAGVEEVPCIVTNMTALEQQYAMWTENEQRQQLTPREQAGGIQLMFDLGATADEIAEKTGLSKKTVKARAEIAKLNQNILERREKQQGLYQLSIQDYEELSRVKDIKERNEILDKGVYSRVDLVTKVEAAIRKQIEKKNEQLLLPVLKKRGFLQTKDQSATWNSKWEILQKIDLSGKSVTIDVNPDNDRQIFWIKYYSWIYIVAKNEKDPSNQSRNKEIEEQEKKTAQLRALRDEYMKELATFIQNVIDCKVTYKENKADAAWIDDKVWTRFSGIRTCVRDDLTIWMEEYSSEREDKSVKENIDEVVDAMIENEPIMTQMLICIFCNLSEWFIDYRGVYVERGAQNQIRFKLLLEELYGYRPSKEEYVRMLYGTHELYRKEGE